MWLPHAIHAHSAPVIYIYIYICTAAEDAAVTKTEELGGVAAGLASYLFRIVSAWYIHRSIDFYAYGTT